MGVPKKKLSEELAKIAYEQYKRGVSVKVLADEYGLSQSGMLQAMYKREKIEQFEKRHSVDTVPRDLCLNKN